MNISLDEHRKEVRTKPVYIVCAALHCVDHTDYEHQPTNINSGFVVCGHRHHNCFAILDIMLIDRNHCDIVQGFLTSDNRFVYREEANKIAFEAKQIPQSVFEAKEQLFSEDLY